MNEACKAQERKTLMNAYEHLYARSMQLEEIAALSEKLIDKLNRTDGGIKKEKCLDGKKDQIPDIVDLFDGISYKLDTLITDIGNNLTKAISIIE